MINNYNHYKKELCNSLAFSFLEICNKKKKILYNMSETEKDYIYNYRLYLDVRDCIETYNRIIKELNINFLCNKNNFKKLYSFILQRSTIFKENVKSTKEYYKELKT